jgi:hypothetical protein
MLLAIILIYNPLLQHIGDETRLCNFAPHVYLPQKTMDRNRANHVTKERGRGEAKLII